MIMNIVNTCTDYGLVGIIHILKNILKFVQLIGPILAAISATIILTKLVANPEEKKYIKQLKNSLIALLFLFAVPIIVNAAMYMLDDSFELTTCWNYADKEVKLDSQFYDTTTKDPSKVLTDPKDYEVGKKRSNSSGNSSSNNTSSSTNSNTTISRRIFIGDSRTVQMYAYLTGDWNGANYSSGGVHVVNNDIFVCEGAKGLAWMKDVGVPEATKYMTNGTAVIILMGVNDLYNLNEYVNYMNSNYSDWNSKGAVVYFDSVNPCTGSYADSLNSKIESFNSGLKSGLNPNIKFIDSHSHLMGSGYTTTDGLHYDGDTSKKIYDYIKSSL